MSGPRKRMAKALEQKAKTDGEKRLQLYVDFLSQPSRGVLIFCRMNYISAEIHIINLAKGQQRTPEFKAINPMSQVPAIDDDGFKLFESHAILRYLCTTYPGVPDHWYPSEPSRRARIDSILDWHHGLGATKLILAAVTGPVFGNPKDPKAAAEAERLLHTALSKLEEIWVPGNNIFLGGSLQPSIADLSLSCEIMQLELLDAEKVSTLLGSREKVRRWISAVKKATSPHFCEVHSLLKKASSRYRADRRKEQQGSQAIGDPELKAKSSNARGVPQLKSKM